MTRLGIPARVSQSRLHTSSTGLGAVLTQRPVARSAYCIPQLEVASTEQNYSTIEWEALAVKWTIESLQYYLTNNPFIFIMDHTPRLMDP